MPELAIEGLLASSQPMEAYGGVRIIESAIESIKRQIDNGFPLSLQHDPRRKVSKKLIRSELRLDKYGYLGLHVTIEVDEEEWAKAGGSDANGFSITACETFLGKEVTAPVISIGADAYWFSDAHIEKSYNSLAKTGLTVQGSRYYHFSALPPQIVHFVMAQIPNLADGTFVSLLYDGLKHFILKQRHPEDPMVPPPSKLDLEFIDEESGSSVRAYLETSSDYILKYAIDTLPPILSNPDEYEFFAEECRWRQREL